MADRTGSEPDQRFGDEGPPIRSLVNVGLLALLAAGVVAFVVQNTEQIPVQWVFFESDAAVWVVIVVSFVAGALFSQLGGWMLRRRRRPQ